MNSRLAYLAVTLVLVLLLNGCAPIDSIFPLYKDEEAVFDDHLLGTWQPAITDTNNADKDQRWTFSHPEGEKYYDFKWSAIGTKGGFVAQVRLVRLGDILFIDFEGDSRNVGDFGESDAVLPYPVIPTHMIGRVWLENDSLLIHFLSDEWVKKQVKAGTFSLAHLDVNGGQILTAQTDDLRTFMQAHAEDTKALSEEFKFTRAK